jgi:hypothetical protein
MDLHKAAHDAASTAQRDAQGHITHLTEKAKKELSQAASHAQRDEHGRFLPEGSSGAGGAGGGGKKGDHEPDMHKIGALDGAGGGGTAGSVAPAGRAHSTLTRP